MQIDESLDKEKSIKPKGRKPKPYTYCMDVVDSPRIVNRILVDRLRKNIKVLFVGFSREAGGFIPELFEVCKSYCKDEWEEDGYYFGQISFQVAFSLLEDVGVDGQLNAPLILKKLEHAHTLKFMQKLNRKDSNIFPTLRANSGMHGLVMVGDNGCAVAINGPDF